MILHRILPLLGILISFVTQGQISPETFFQTTQRTIALPLEADNEVIRLFQTNDKTTAITTKGAFYFSKGKWTPAMQPATCLVATLDPEGSIWIGTSENIRNLNQKAVIKLDTTLGSLRCLFWDDDHTLYAGTLNGLYAWDGAWRKVIQLGGAQVNDIVKDAGGTLWVATLDGLWQCKKNRWVNMDETVMAVGNERKYYALAVDNKGKDLIFSSLKTIGCIANDGNHWVWRGTDGLPYGPSTVIRRLGDAFWLGTGKGVIVKDTAWHYYAGRRWLPDDAISDILETAPGVIWIGTPKGISEIRKVPMTLEQKASAYEQVIEQRHNRRGLINVSKMKIPGDVTTSYTENEDNDGLWTSCYLAAECFRYAATGSPEAKRLATRTFEALERLETVTGISGYPARSYALAADKVARSQSPHPKTWHPSPDGKWQWLDDTSSDEITGHLFAMSLFYELVADDAQKKRIVNLIDRIVSHIVDHDFHLIDFDGKATRWGVWHPDSLNNSPNWMTERGLNSLQMLSHLKTAFHYTGKERYETTYQMLVTDHGYLRNALQAKMYGPFETSHSDDILNFFPYYGLIKYGRDDPDYPIYMNSLQRSWQHVEHDHMPVWNVITSALTGEDQGLATAKNELQDYPLDLVDWSIQNSHRWDLIRDPLVDRSKKPQATTAVPSSESGISRWNTNPKRLDVGNQGKTEETGTYFLFAYWMGRYHGFWE